MKVESSFDVLPSAPESIVNEVTAPGVLTAVIVLVPAPPELATVCPTLINLLACYRSS